MTATIPTGSSAPFGSAANFFTPFTPISPSSFLLGASGMSGAVGATQGVGGAALNGTQANLALMNAFANSTTSGFAPAIGPGPMVMQSIFSRGWRANS